MIRFLLIAVAVLFLTGSAPPAENVLPDAPFAQAPAEVATVTQAHAMISAAAPKSCGCTAVEAIDALLLGALLALRTVSERMLTGHH